MIVFQIFVTLGISYAIYLLLVYALAFQPSFELPVSPRLLGLIPIAAGVGVGLETLRYRPPREMLASTSITLMKLARRTPVGDTAGRTEPFNPAGPYQYVRNPLYLGVVLLSFGLGIALSSVPLLLWGAVLVCWFWFFLIPFEERELGALFGESYAEYRRKVPKLFPYRKRSQGTRRVG